MYKSKPRRYRYRKKQNNCPKLTYCNQVFGIESILCQIYTYVDFQCLFTRCKLVNKWWNHAAKQPQSIEYFSMIDLCGHFWEQLFPLRALVGIVKLFRFAKHVSLKLWGEQDGKYISTQLMRFSKIERISLDCTSLWNDNASKQVIHDLMLKNWCNIHDIEFTNCSMQFQTNDKHTLVFHNLTRLKMVHRFNYLLYADLLQELILDDTLLGVDELKHLSMSNLSNLETLKMNHIRFIDKSQGTLSSEMNHIKQLGQNMKTMIVNIGNQFKPENLKHLTFSTEYYHYYGGIRLAEIPLGDNFEKAYTIQTFLYSLGMQLIDTISTRCKSIHTLSLSSKIHDNNLGITDIEKYVDKDPHSLDKEKSMTRIHNEYEIDKLHFRFDAICNLKIKYCSAWTKHQKQAVFDLITKKVNQQPYTIKFNGFVIINHTCNITYAFRIKQLLMSVVEKEGDCCNACAMLTDVLELFTKLSFTQDWHFQQRINSATFKITTDNWWSFISIDKMPERLKIMAKIASIARNVTKHLKFELLFTYYDWDFKPEAIFKVFQFIQHIKDSCNNDNNCDYNYVGDYNSLMLDVRMEMHKDFNAKSPELNDADHEKYIQIWFDNVCKLLFRPAYDFQPMDMLTEDTDPIVLVYQSKRLNIDDVAVKLISSEKTVDILLSVKV